MREIQLKDAKATLSSVVDDALGGTGTIITRHGRREAVLISYADYEKLSTVPSFGWLLAHAPLPAGDPSARHADVDL